MTLELFLTIAGAVALTGKLFSIIDYIESGKPLSIKFILFNK